MIVSRRLLGAPAATFAHFVSASNGISSGSPSAPLGQYTWSAAAAGLDVLGPSHICAKNVTGGTVTVDVTEQEGKVLPYPDLVTSDYLRRYTIHVEMTGNASSCGAISMIADFEVEQAATDVVAHRDAVCYCL